MIEAYLQSKEEIPATPSFQQPNHLMGRDETGSKLDPKFDDSNVSDAGNSEISMEDPKSLSDTSTTEPAIKFQRVGEQGKIVSGYYTPAADEKLRDFQATYINIGNPRILKEVVGIRKNSTFISTGKKKSGSGDKLLGANPSYLVVSFENRKKANSPYVEYPLNKIGVLIRALEDLKERAISEGYHSEAKIMKCDYPQNTIITDKNCKDTVLTTLQ